MQPMPRTVSGGILINEISGGTYIAQVTNYLSSWSGGTKCWSGPSPTLIQQPALMIAFASDDTGSGTATAGTGFTDLGTFWNGVAGTGARMESQVLTSTAPANAVFGISVNEGFFVIASFFANTQPTRLYANGQFRSNTFIEGGSQLGGGLCMKLYANGNTQILNMVESTGISRLYANGTYSTNNFSEQ